MFTIASPLECAFTKNVAATSLESALRQFLDLKFFTIRTYEKVVGGRGVPHPVTIHDSRITLRLISRGGWHQIRWRLQA